MGGIRKFKRVKIGKANRDEMELAKDLAKEAMLKHEEGVQFAADILSAAIEDIGPTARDECKVTFRPYMSEMGHGTIVSLCEETDEGPQYHQEILVATKPDTLAVTDDAIATAVGYTTKALTFIPDEDGKPISGFVVWQGSTDPRAVGIQTAISTHF
jgi:hypothetical protein